MSDYTVYILLLFWQQISHFFLRGKGIFSEKTSMPVYTGIDFFEIPVLYRPPAPALKIQYRIGNTSQEGGELSFQCLRPSTSLSWVPQTKIVTQRLFPLFLPLYV
jgi:hypothetical protein